MTTDQLAQVGALVVGLAVIAAATVAVCIGKIDAPTYIGLIGPVAGLGLGVGAHASGTVAGAKAASTGTPPNA